MWAFLAFLSALFAALTSILAKIGIDGISSNLATAIRTSVILLLVWGIVIATGVHNQISTLSSRNWWFLIGSGLATGISWLCYFKALQLGNVSRVAPIDKFSIVLTVIMAFIFLHETVTAKVIAGCVLIATGTLLMIL